jgi:hypothetical protein
MPQSFFGFFFRIDEVSGRAVVGPTRLHVLRQEFKNRS